MQVATSSGRRGIEGTWLDHVNPPSFPLSDFSTDAAQTPTRPTNAAKLEDAGATIDEIRLPASRFAREPPGGYGCRRRDCSRAQLPTVRRYRDGISTMIEYGNRLGVEYRTAIEHQKRIAVEGALSPGGGSALCPASVDSAPPMSENTTGDAKFNAPWSFSGLPTGCQLR